MNDIGNKQVMAKNLKRVMKEQGVTAKELSDKLQFPYTTVLSWLKADNYPRIDKIELMADFFGILKSDLIEDNSGQKEKPTVNDDGLSDDMKIFMEFARKVPEHKLPLALRLLKTILEEDE